MVLLCKEDALNQRISKRNKIFLSMLMAAGCLITSLLIIVIDPLSLIVKYKLRLGKDTILYNLLQVETPAAKLHVFLFNISNAEKFMSGEDTKLKVQEIGPFVYQEYRWYEDLSMSEDNKLLRMTPRARAEFVPEESIANPKELHLTLPNLAMLSVTSIMSNYPYLLRYTYSMMAARLKATAIIDIDVHNYLWGYEDHLVTLSNNLAPGMVYFKKLGLLDRLYDNGSYYKVEVGATYQDRFNLKSVKKFTHLQLGSIEDTEETEQKFVNTYEGYAYPPNLTPEVPISIYRLGVCKTFDLEYLGSKSMEYGGEAFVYTISNKTFMGDRNVSPVTKLPYPDGVMDYSDCFFGLPYAASKGHFLDADPRLLDRTEGLHPDRNVHLNEIVIDREVSITCNTSMSLQLALMLNDISYNNEAKMFSNMAVPIIHIKVSQPEMTPEIASKFILVFQTAPKIVLSIVILLSIIGSWLISYAIRSMYCNFMANKREMVFHINANDKTIKTEAVLDPLLLGN